MIGLHDFGSFARPNPGGTTIRDVKSACWERVGTRANDVRVKLKTGCVPPVEQGLLEFTIVADAFAHNMVRSLCKLACRLGVVSVLLIGLRKRSMFLFVKARRVQLILMD